MELIGVSLSEHHTSGTALQTCVCMFVCLLVAIYTINVKAYFTKLWTLNALMYLLRVGEGYSQIRACYSVLIT